MGRSKAQRYRAQRDRRRREKKEQAARQATLQTNEPTRIREVAARMGSFVKIWFGRTWKMIVAVAVVVQYVSYAQSRLAVVPRDALDPNAPLSAPFIIENRGYLAFYDLRFGCFLRDVRWWEAMHMTETSFENTTGGYVGDLPPEGQTTISCDFIVSRSLPIQGADIDIAVWYRPIFFPWPVEKRFRFTTAETAHGNLMWLPQLSPPKEK